MPPRKKADPKPPPQKSEAKPPTPLPAPPLPPPANNDAQTAPPAPPAPPVEAAAVPVEAPEPPAIGSAAWRRADNVRALKEELAMCKAGGKAERVKAIEAELRRYGAPAGRTAAPKDEA